MNSASKITLIAAIMQILILSILETCGRMLYRQPVSREKALTYANLSNKNAFFAIVTLCLLIFSNPFVTNWGEVIGFSGPNFIHIQWSSALRFVFILDIIWVSVLVGKTGGSYRSPFTPVYFFIPSLASLLGESPRRILGYTLMVAVCFTFNFTYDVPPDTSKETYQPPMSAFWFVSVASFVVSTIVTFIMRAQ
jgi:hypothetical protein